MSLAVAIQMDPIESVNIDTDSTFVLALEAQRRGHALWHYLPQHLVLRDGRLYARARRLEVRRLRGDHFTLGQLEMLDLVDDRHRADAPGPALRHGLYHRDASPGAHPSADPGA